MPAPDFRAQAMVNGEFKEITLSDFEGRFLVLFFYPLDFTFVCPTEILAFSDRVEEFERLGASVVAASVDSPYTHLAWWKTPRQDGGIAGTRFPILSDLTKSIAESYGVLLEDGTALRGLFVIDRKGTVRQITINDLAIGRSVDEVLRVIQAIQFADEHGEVCPANWKPGDKTIKPSPSESKEFFSKVK
jgi:peroxiredoxin (alkyl hydroperoxide reductase subunit C)